MVTGPMLTAASGLAPYDPGPPRVLADRPQELFEVTKNYATQAAEVEPNAGHRAITICQERMKAASGQLTILTLNTDDLHERCHSQVTHVYGQLSWEICPGCEMRSPAIHKPGTCGCGAERRPDVALKGEGPKSDAVLAFKLAMGNAEAFICVGTPGDAPILRRWVSTASRKYRVPTLLVTPEPDPEFAAKFDVVIDECPTEVRHYLPR